jgi:Flp pilus assembly protein TadG
MRRHRDQRGSETIEFSLVAPIFFLAVIAAFSLTRLAFLKTATAQAAKEAARYASVSLPCPSTGSGVWCTSGKRTFPDAGTVASRVNARVPLFSFAASDFTISFTSRSGTCTLNAANCSPPPPNATVTVQVNKTIPQPFRPFAGIFNLGTTINATASGITRSE